MSESPTLSVCLHQAKGAAKLAAAWAEAADLFGHDGAVARRCAREARAAASAALAAARETVDLAPAPERARSEQAQRALAAARRTREYAAQAAASATHAVTSAKAAKRFTPATGMLSDLCRVRQQAVMAWLSCPEHEKVKLAVLRARVEEAEAAVQAALPVPATA